MSWERQAASTRSGSQPRAAPSSRPTWAHSREWVSRVRGLASQAWLRVPGVTTWVLPARRRSAAECSTRARSRWKAVRPGCLSGSGSQRSVAAGSYPGMSGVSVLSLVSLMPSMSPKVTGGADRSAQTAASSRPWATAGAARARSWRCRTRRARAGWSPSGAAAIQGARAAARAAKRPGAVKQEATAIRWRPRAARAATASGTVGAAAEAYAGTTGTPPRRSPRRAAMRRVSAPDRGSREPAAARTTPVVRRSCPPGCSPGCSPGCPLGGQPASVRRPARASTRRGWAPRGAATRARRPGAAATAAGRSWVTWCPGAKRRGTRTASRPSAARPARVSSRRGAFSSMWARRTSRPGRSSRTRSRSRRRVAPVSYTHL